MNRPTVHEIERQKILQGLLDAVKECQRRYGGKTELATESNSSVNFVLTQFEIAFQHGLKRGKVWGAINSLSEPLRHVTGNLLHSLPEVEPTFWPFAKEHLGDLEMQRFLALSHVTTDQGRARSFLRASLNEHSLERHVTSFLASHSILRQYYEDWSLLLDDEKASTLPSMARGLAPILFAVQIDHPSLNESFGQAMSLQPSKATKTTNGNFVEPLPVINGDPETVELGNACDSPKLGRKKKKRKVNTVEVCRLDYDGSIDDQSQDEINSVTTHQAQDEHKQVATTEMVSSSVNATRKESSNDSVEDDVEGLEFSPGKVSEDISIIERVASLSTSFKRSMSVTSQGSDSSPPKARASSQIELFSRDLEEEIFDVTNFSPELNFQLENQKSFNVEPFCDTINTVLKNDKAQGGVGYSNQYFLKDNVFNQDEMSKDAYVTKDDAPIPVVVPVLTAPQMPSDFQESSEQYNEYETASYSDRNDKMTFLRGDSGENAASDLLSTVLGAGEHLSVSEGAFEKLLLEKQLRTPPATPNVTDTFNNNCDVERDVRDVEKRIMTPVNGMKELSRLFKDKLGDRFEYEGSTSHTMPPTVNNMGTNIAQGWEVIEGDVENKEHSKGSDQEDEQSVSSSTTENDSLGILQPVGYDGSKFHDLVMAYDVESMKAASDTLALLDHSNNIAPVFRQETLIGNSIGDTDGNGGKVLCPDFSGGSDNSLSVGDLKQAVLLTAKRKDHLEEQNRALQTLLDEEKEYSSMLKGEVDRYQEQLTEVQERSQQKLHDLSRENNVLRNQLKKYVAAVQLLRRDNKSMSFETSEAISTLRGLRGEPDFVLVPEHKERSASENDSLFEDKLSQMAEMHGELLEFNEHLQRQLIQKETQVVKMKEELVSLRGPLPQDLNESESSSCGESSGGKPLINIWIPSVFIKGKGSDAYHVYQVYVRIGDDEWNIYRRYSQFFKLHSKAAKQFPCLANFNFPPKKFLGKKDLKFVEGRRKRLQEYLRNLINLTLAANTFLSNTPNKRNLVKIEPFFGEAYSDEEKKSNSKKLKKKDTSAVYTGL